MRFPSLPFARFARLRRHATHAELVAYQCASLPAADAHHITRHVAACPACAAELDSIGQDFALLDDSFRADASLATLAAEDWRRLVAALPGAEARRPSPEVLAAYLGNYARSATATAPLEVLETLLGARASAAVAAGSRGAKDRP